jgi:hypothetical protein
MANGSELNPILDAVILLLALVLLYLLLKGKSFSFKTRQRHIENFMQKKDLDEIKEKAKTKLSRLLDAKSKCQKEVSDAKRRYMKGDITYEAMKIIINQADARHVEIEEQLSEFEGIYE